MKLRLVLFSFSILLSCSLRLNAQEEREARRRPTTAAPPMPPRAKGANPGFGPHVLIFDPSMPAPVVQKQIDAVYAIEEHNEFGEQRNALLFLPGNYSVDVPVGFYTEVDRAWRVARRNTDCGQRACGCQS